MLAACKTARTWLAPGVWPGCPVEARARSASAEKPPLTGWVRSPFRAPGRAAVRNVGFGESGGAPRRDGRGPPDSGCCAPLCLASAVRDDRAQAPRSKSATPGGRFLIGRARADLPVELRTLDGNLGRALQAAGSATRQPAYPTGYLLAATGIWEISQWLTFLFL